MSIKRKTRGSTNKQNSIQHIMIDYNHYIRYNENLIGYIINPKLPGAK